MTERNWEASARARLERLVDETVGRIRDAADQIEREAKAHVASAAQDERGLEFQTYPRVAGRAIHTVQTLLLNLSLGSMIDAASDAEAARTEHKNGTTHTDRTSVTAEADKLAGAVNALARMFNVLDGWIEGARSNHDALGHRGESTGSECWTQFHPSDIRNMINDAAREVGLAEFPLPKVATEDKVR